MASSDTSTDLITLKPEMKLNTIEDLRALTSGDKFQVEVKNTYGKIDIHQTFASLVDAGMFLKVACAAANGQNCRKHVVGVMSDYQDVVHSNLVTCNKFILNSISALDNHRTALEFLAMLDQGEGITLPDVLDPVLDALADCYKVATEMSSEADAAAKLVGNLSTKAAGALKEATADHTTNTKKNEKTQETIDELIAETDARENRIAKFKKNLIQLQGEKVQAAKDASKERDREFALKLTETIISGTGKLVDGFAKCANPVASIGISAVKEVSDQLTTGSKEGKTPTVPTAVEANSKIDELEQQVASKQQLVDGAKKAENADTADGKKKILEKEKELKSVKDSLKNCKDTFSEVTKNQQPGSQSIEEKEAMLTKMYYKMAEDEMKVAEKQQKDLAALSTMKVNKTELQRTIFLLSFTIGIMGDVKTTFVNCKTFWELLAEQCKQLASCKDTILQYGENLKDPRKVKVFRNMFQKGVKDGAYRWASVGLVCIQAYDGIVDAKDTIDDAMSNLVISQDDLENVIKTFGDRIQSKINLHMPAVEGGKKVGLLTEA